MTVLNLNLYYNEVCYKGTALYAEFNLNLSMNITMKCVIVCKS